MSSPLNRLHASPRPRLIHLPLAAAALASLALFGPQVGCDNSSDRADRAVDAQVEEGRSGAAPRPGEAPGVPGPLSQAVGNADASPAAKAEALSWLGQSEVRRASALLDRAGRDDIAARRLISEINRLGTRLESNAAIMASLQKLEPSKERAALQSGRGAIQGESDPVWIKHETGPLPALKGVEEKLARLQDEVSKLEQQAKQLSAQRSRQLTEAERLERESEGAAGKQSVDLYNRSAAARKKGADLGVQADAVRAKLLPLQQDLQLAKNQQQLLANAVKAFDARIQGTEQNWKTVQQQVEAIGVMSKSLLGPAPNEPPAPPADFTSAASGPPPEAGADAAPGADPAAAPSAAAPVTRPAGQGGAGGTMLSPSSLAGKLRWLSHLVKSAEAQRAEAEGLLNSALGHYKSAGDAADALNRDLSQKMSASGASQRPERPSWQRLADLHNPSEYKLKQAAVQLLLAGSQRDRAAMLAARSNTAKTLAPVLQANKLPAPQELGEHNVENDVKAARDASAAAYKEADTLLTDVIETKSNETMTRAARAAHTLKLAGMYGQAQLAAQTNPQDAARIIAAAKQLATQAEGDLPAAAALPGFIQDVLELRAPTTAPAGARPPGATTPAPAPAPGPAPTPAPTTPTPTTPTAPAPTPDAATPPAGAEQPAPGTEQPAPGTAQPASATEQPAPETEQPAAGTEQPASTEQPAPAPEQPAPTPDQPTPTPDQPTPAPEQPAPDGSAPPAPEGEQPAPTGQ